MRRLTVLTALVLCSAAWTTAVATSPVPRIETQRIVAELGRTYVPATIPAGYIYIRWSVNPGSADVFGDALEIDFGKHGRLITWTVENWHDPQAVSYDDCARHNRTGDKVIPVAGRKAYYIGGAVGQSATVCLPGYQAIVVWNRYSISATALAKLAATPRRIG